jgi:hypothetical protein
MFGFFRFKKSVGLATEYVRTLIAPAQVHGTLPNAIFGDAYVLGFIQQIVMHAAQENEGSKLAPEHLPTIFEATIGNFVPGIAARQITPLLIEVNKPAHPSHTHYSVGCREGRKYIDALRVGDRAQSTELLFLFTQFIKKNYMGV